MIGTHSPRSAPRLATATTSKQGGEGSSMLQQPRLVSANGHTSTAIAVTLIV
jgi:hypothetical protein